MMLIYCQGENLYIEAFFKTLTYLTQDIREGFFKQIYHNLVYSVFKRTIPLWSSTHSVAKRSNHGRSNESFS